MNEFYNFWLNKLGYLNIAVLLIAGYLIISNKKVTKLIALYLYLFHNLIMLLRGCVTTVDSFIVSGIIFGVLTLINISRVIKKK